MSLPALFCRLVSHSAALREALARVPLFESCSGRDLQIIARHMQVVAIEQGTVLMREGENGDAFYVALQGSADAVRGGRVVAAVEPGDYIGELALIDPAPRTATVTARSAMVIGVIDHRAFTAIIRDVPAMNLKLMRALVRRVRERDRQAVPG